MADWQDRIVGARMAVDNEFTGRVEGSSFSRQEWGLVMTATEFDIEDGDEPRLYADTSSLRDVMPELEKVAKQTAMGAPQQQDDAGGGVLGSLKSALGLGGGSSSSGGGKDREQRVREAEQLTDEYASKLQERLEANGSWDDVVRLYREGDS
jgi:hypothetical protein